VTVVAVGDLEFAELPGRRSSDPFPGADAASSMRIVEMERTPGRRAHRHPHSVEMVFVADGSGAVWIDGVETPVSRGDVVLVPADTPHGTIPDEGGSMRLVCFFPHPRLADNLVETDIEITETEGETP